MCLPFHHAGIARAESSSLRVGANAKYPVFIWPLLPSWPSVLNPGDVNHDDKAPAQIIAMHGWAGDSRCWKPWIKATEHLGWHWQCGERGYGEISPRAPAWPADFAREARRVVIGHSLGPHLIPKEVWQSANAAVLLASFGTFVPPTRAGRRARMALDGMAAQLGNETDAKEMLSKFLTNVAHPEPPELLPAGPEEGSLNLGRLRDDLEILANCQGLPPGFPSGMPVLIVEAGEERIVDAEARAMLRAALPNAEFVLLPDAGHALLQTGIVSQAADWVQSLR
jgi:pimeloyl-[acyl-carrier protein] methyl ester esterase